MAKSWRISLNYHWCSDISLKKASKKIRKEITNSSTVFVIWGKHARELKLRKQENALK